MKQDTVVTGGGGFVGRWLCERLGPCCLRIPYYQIAGAPMPSCRRVFFLSTYGNLYYHQDALRILQANCFDVIALATRLRWKCGSFVFVSTSSVNLPVQTMYSRCKLLSEMWLLSSKRVGFHAKVVRPLSVTGVGEQKQHLIPTLIRSCFDGEVMEFDPDAEHDYIDVQDVVSGLIAASDDSRCGPFELGWGRSLTNQEVRSLVENAANSKANVVIKRNLRAYDGAKWASRGQEEWPMRWKPEKPLVNSIREMVEAYERSRKALY